MSTIESSNKPWKVRIKQFFVSRKRFLIRAAVVSLVFFSSVAYANNRFIFGLDPQGENRCLPWVFYIIDTHQRDIRKNHYFAYSAERMEPIVTDGTIALKKAAGAPGDRVVIEKNRTLIEGSQQPNSHLVLPPIIEPLYQSKEALTRELIVPDGEIFAMGTQEGSYDSRYWGTVRADQIIGRAFPIF